MRKALQLQHPLQRQHLHRDLQLARDLLLPIERVRLRRLAHEPQLDALQPLGSTSSFHIHDIE